MKKLVEINSCRQCPFTKKWENSNHKDLVSLSCNKLSKKKNVIFVDSYDTNSINATFKGNSQIPEECPL